MIDSVMITCNYQSGESVAVSGLMFSGRWVLTHGTILSPLKHVTNKTFNGDFHKLYLQLPDVHVMWEGINNNNITDKSPTTTDVITSNESCYNITCKVGRVCYIWKCPALESSVSDVLSHWTIGHKDEDLAGQTHLGKVLMSVYVLIDLEHNSKNIDPLVPLSILMKMVGDTPSRGTKIYIKSTPFGCEAFLNSTTQGWVCGRVGHTRPTLLLTDASTALGSEGAPVFINTNNINSAIIGMVVNSISWWRGEWVGLTLVSSLKTSLLTKLHTQIQANIYSNNIDSKQQVMLNKFLDKIDTMAMLIKCGNMWGTGIYLGDGYILTCAHVINNHLSENLSVYCRGTKQTAIVRYKTPYTKPYDLALLYSNPEYWTHMTHVKFTKELPKKGEPVVAVGYPFFNENNLKHIKPMITSGNINNVSPSMIQTSCCIQSGFSGGAILRLNRELGNDENNNSDDYVCEFVAIIVSNAKTQNTDACYPYINMAIPVHAFHNTLTQYINTKDEQILKNIEVDKEIIQSQWKLSPYRSKL